MTLEELLIDENINISKAARILEEKKSKIIYAVRGGKLVGSISDGDIRRFVSNSVDLSNLVSSIINYNCVYAKIGADVSNLFYGNELYSIPIVNDDMEIIEVKFRDGRSLKRKNNHLCPVVMMAGGKGTRLYPYTKILPKALVPIGDIPISERIFDMFFSYNCELFLMIVNHKKEMIKAYFSNFHKYNIYTIDEEMPLGTAGGLDLIRDKIETDFFVTNCDILVDTNYSEVLSLHRRDGNAITIVAAEYTNEVPYGVINCNLKNEYVGFKEKPINSYTINTGLYVMSKIVLNYINENEILSMPELIERVHISGNRIGVYVVPESKFMDMGQLEELEKMQIKLMVR